MRKHLIIPALAIALAGCSADSESAAPTTTATPEQPTTTIAAFTRNEAAYLVGVKRREAERATQFTDAELVRWGDRGCEAMSDGVRGAGDELEQAMVQGGVESELAYRVASDLNNAAAGTLCDPPGPL